MRRSGWLRDAAQAPVAGRMMAVLDLAARWPRGVGYDADPHGPDARFWDPRVAAIPAGALVLFDLGFTDFARWATLTARRVSWLSRAKKNLKYEVVHVLVTTATVRDRVVWIGAGATRQQGRLIEVQAHGTVYRYLTNALEPARLPTAQAVALCTPSAGGSKTPSPSSSGCWAWPIATAAPKTPLPCQ